MREPSNYETVAVSQTDQVLGTNGRKGDWLEALIITVATSATSTVTLEDGATGAAIPIMAANTPIGVYVVKLQMASKLGGWQITTGAGATVIAVGDFG